MDIMIPYKLAPEWNNNELRFALRSVEKHLKGFERLFIVGEKPDWLINCVHIPMGDDWACRQRNIMEKIKRVCQENISDRFLFMNDDHFLLRPMFTESIVHWYHGTLKQALKLHEKPNYLKTIQNTITALEGIGANTLHYDIHVPIVYDKNDFPKLMDQFDWSIVPTYVIKSLYANMYSHWDAEEMTDNKYMMVGKINLNHKFLSVSDFVDRSTRRTICNLFPEKSRWEI